MGYTIDYWAIAPEIILALTIMMVLTAELVLPRSLKWVTAVVAVMGTILAAFPLVILGLSDYTRSMFDGSYVVDDFALVMKGLFLAAGILVMFMSIAYIEADRFYQGEYYFLLVSSILGAVVMSSARDLIILFIGLELVTGPLFSAHRVAQGRHEIERGRSQILLVGRAVHGHPALRNVVHLRSHGRADLRRDPRGITGPH